MTLRVLHQIIPFPAKEGNLFWPLKKKKLFRPFTSAKFEGMDALASRERRAETCSTKCRNLTPRRDLPSLTLPSPVTCKLAHLQAPPAPTGSCSYSWLQPLSPLEATGRRAKIPRSVLALS